MQVGLNNTTTSGLPSPLTRGNVEQPQSIKQRNVANTQPAADFPDSPLISTRPLRYNVQLNKQLTAVQQADDFLLRTENQLLVLRQAIGQSSSGGDVKTQAETLKHALNSRPALSGGAVDRKMNVVLSGEPQVHFRFADNDKLLRNARAETLIFSLGGNQRDLAAVALPDDATPRQTLMLLNQGLGRFGIQGKADRQGNLVFSVDESKWARVSTHLSVRGENNRFSDTEFSALKTEAQPALENNVTQIAGQPAVAHKQLGALQQAIEHINQQRGQLTQNKTQVRSRIESMSTFKQGDSAVNASAQLGKMLENAATNFTIMTQAIGGQANVHSATVRNLLSV